MFATPSAVLGMWFRGLLAICVLVLAAWLVARWYDALPSVALDVRSAPHVEQTQPRTLTFVERVSAWQPALDWPTAMLGGAMALVLWSCAGRIVNRRLLRPRETGSVPTPAPAEVHRLKQPDGTELHVEVCGPSNAPTVILTHGWGVNSGEWVYLRRDWSTKFRVIVWDLPGLGKSSRSANGDYSLERMAAGLKTVIDFSNASNIVLVGHSIGGMIMLTLAKVFPELLPRPVSKMVIVHSSYTNPLRTMRFHQLMTALQKPLIEPLLYLQIGLSPLVWLMNWMSYFNGSAHNSVARTGFAGTESRDKLDLIASFSPKASPAVLARGGLAMCRYDATGVLKTLPIPVLIFAGDKDPVTLPEASQRMASDIPENRLHTLVPAKHYGMIEHNVDFAGAAAAFCSPGQIPVAGKASV